MSCEGAPEALGITPYAPYTTHALYILIWTIYMILYVRLYCSIRLKSRVESLTEPRVAIVVLALLDGRVRLNEDGRRLYLAAPDPRDGQRF